MACGISAFLFYMEIALRSVATTICTTPLLSLLPACNPIRPTAPWADFPRLTMVQSTTFGQLLDETAGSTSLSLDIRKAEMATADLATLVRMSKLRTRETLADTLTSFVADARVAATGLVKLRVKVRGAADR